MAKTFTITVIGDRKALAKLYELRAKVRVLNDDRYTELKIETISHSAARNIARAIGVIYKDGRLCD